MSVGVISYVYKAGGHALASRVNNVVSGFRLQVAYIFYLIVLYADVGFYRLVAFAVKNQSVFNYCGIVRHGPKNF